jgi:glutamine amidotransferase-like uncharacterized protein
MKANQFSKKPRHKIATRHKTPHKPSGESFDDGSENRPRHYAQNGAYKNYQQQIDKYLTLAKDHLSSGDRVMAEYHYQYADHYVRLMNERNEQRAQRQQQQMKEQAEQMPAIVEPMASISPEPSTVLPEATL